MHTRKSTDPSLRSNAATADRIEAGSENIGGLRQSIDPFDDGLQARVPAAAVHTDSRSISREALGNGATDPWGGAGDERYSPLLVLPSIHQITAPLWEDNTSPVQKSISPRRN
nr:hypothetical protein GCM10017611_02610 [Rhodococcus wratislaviensis]